MVNKIIVDNQQTVNTDATVSITSLEVISKVNKKVLGFTITNTSSTAICYVAKGDMAAVVGRGLPIYPGQTMSEFSMPGAPSWQGAVQVIADAAGTIAISQTFEV